MNMRLPQSIVIAALGAIAVAASGLALRPFNRKEPAPSPLFKGAKIDRTTVTILARACLDCHSDRTRWTWYSYLPPASWLIHRDVNAARANLDFGRWHDYTHAQRQAFLSAIGGAVRSGAMPPGRYTLLHPAGRLTRAEREQVYRWTRAERSRAADPVQAEPGTRDTTRYAAISGGSRGDP